jgi:hypothetical protein
VHTAARRLYFDEAFEVETQLTAMDFGADRGRQFMRLRIVERVAKDGLGIVRNYFRNSFGKFEEAFGDVVLNSDISACMIVTDETMRNDMGHDSPFRVMSLTRDFMNPLSVPV